MKLSALSVISLHLVYLGRISSVEIRIQMLGATFLFFVEKLNVRVHTMCSNAAGHCSSFVLSLTHLSLTLTVACRH